MADENQLKLILQGVQGWNKWRKEHPSVSVNLDRAYLEGANLIEANLRGADLNRAYLNRADIIETDLEGAKLGRADLREANLNGTNLFGADLHRANLEGANLREAYLNGANLNDAYLKRANLKGAKLIRTDLNGANLKGAYLKGAYLRGAYLKGAYLNGANLNGAYLREADLREANLNGACLKGADLRGADLTEAILQHASLVETNLEQAVLTHCKIYGISAWGLKGTPKDQSGLVITPYFEEADNAEITVDDLQVAQFVYLLLNNQNVRNVIDTITSKAVLILGRFTDERKAILKALQGELRQRNYLPILFDFTGPQNRDITETVSTLAHMAKFVIADITDAKSIPQELEVIVPKLPSVPVQPMLLASQQEYGMFGHYKRYPWVLPTSYYQDVKEAVTSLATILLPRLEAKVLELRKT